MMMKKKDESDMNERAAGLICTRDACVVALNSSGVSQWPSVWDEVPQSKSRNFHGLVLTALWRALVRLLGVWVSHGGGHTANLKGIAAAPLE
jgi:hypothetical protein